jgi:hypothetical protein
MRTDVMDAALLKSIEDKKPANPEAHARSSYDELTLRLGQVNFIHMIARRKIKIPGILY